MPRCETAGGCTLSLLPRSTSMSLSLSPGSLPSSSTSFISLATLPSTRALVEGICLWRVPAFSSPGECCTYRLVPHWFSPAATSWGHSKCRGRLARDGPSPRIAAVRLGPWVQSEAPRLSLGRGGEPRAHSVPRSRISTPSFERHRGHNTASRPYSIAARLLKRDLVAIPSGQLNTPLRAGIAPGPATARRLAGTLALSTDPMRANTPTGAHTHSAAAAHATAHGTWLMQRNLSPSLVRKKNRCEEHRLPPPRS